MADGIRDLGVHEADLIGRIIAAGFHDDPVMCWCLNGTGAIAPLNAVLAREIYLAQGFGHCTEDNRSGTLWLKPGKAGGLSFMATLELSWHLLRHGGVTALRRGPAVGDFMTRTKPTEPHYYLYSISVDPASQGKGVGGRLLRAGLALADADGMPAYLENSKERNLPFYRANGFEVLEKVHPLPGCPPLWQMLRPAQRAS